MQPATAIDRWEDWPDDVRPLLRRWNHAGLARLRFERGPAFYCADCYEFCEPHRYGVATLDQRHLCDGCLIDVAREFSKRDNDKQRWLEDEPGRLAEWIDDRVWVMGA